MLVHFAIAMTIDTTRAIFGPLPRSVCVFGIFVKNIFFTNIAQSIMAVTVFKFLFVTVFQSIPVMDDDFLSTFLALNFNMISILASLVRLNAPGRPILNELICVGQFYPQWLDETEPIQPFGIIGAICFLVHVILTFGIQISKKKDPTVQNHGVNLGDIMTTWMAMLFLLISSAVLSKFNSTNPENLHQYPNSLLLYYTHFFIPVGGFSIACLVFFGTNRHLRKALFKSFRSRMCRNSVHSVD